jgi:hypothetical protein
VVVDIYDFLPLLLKTYGFRCAVLDSDTNYTCRFSAVGVHRFFRLAEAAAEEEVGARAGARAGATARGGHGRGRGAWARAGLRQRRAVE